MLGCMHRPTTSQRIGARASHLSRALLLASLLVASAGYAQAQGDSLCARGRSDASKQEAVASARSDLTEHVARAKDPSTLRTLRCIDRHFERYVDEVSAACQAGAADTEILALIEAQLRACF